MKRVLITLLLLSSTISLASVRLTGKVKSGNGSLFSGKVVITLPVATQDTNLNEAVCPCQFEFPVQNGTFPANANVVATSIMSPSNVYYILQFFDPYGRLQMTLNAANIIEGSGTYDIGQATPTAITTAQISYITPASLSANQVWTGNNTYSQPIISTVATSTAPLSIASTTSVPNLGASHLVSDSTPVAATSYPTAPIRLAAGDELCWRNSDNTNDNCIFVQAGRGSLPVPSNDALSYSVGAVVGTFATGYKWIGNTFTNSPVSNNAAEVVVSSVGTFHTNDILLSDVYVAHTDGVVTNTSGGNITYTLRFRLDSGGTLLCASAGVVVATGTVAAPVHLNCQFTIQAVGAGGTMSPAGDYTINATSGDIANAALVAVDTTVDHIPAFTEQMSVANANGSITLRQFWIERKSR